MQSSAHRASMPNSPTFLRFLISCLLSKHLDPVEKILHEHFPKRSQTLAKYLALTMSNFESEPPPPPHDVACIGSHRLGLNVSQERFRMAKSILSQCYVTSGTLANVLHLKLSPYVVMYAAIDLDIPLPDGFDMWFLWRHVEQLLQLGRTADLVDDSGELPPLLHGPVMPPEYKHDGTEDPDGMLQQLYRFHYHAQAFHSSSFPKSKRPLSELPPIQLTVVASDDGTEGEVWNWNGGRAQHHWFGLKRRASGPAFRSSREAYALLDATCCWGLAWRGHTVRVNLSNQRLVWALNDFIDATAEFPVVEVLLSLASRCGFEFMAVHSPSCLAIVNGHARGRDNKFSEGSGLVLPLMDVVLSDVPFAKGNLCDLEDVVLSTYRAILVSCGARGYTEGLHNSGMLYSEMRNRQVVPTIYDDIHTARHRAHKKALLEGPGAHLSLPDWQRTLQRRLEERRLGGDTGPAENIPPKSESLVATRVQDPASVPIVNVQQPLSSEERLEAEAKRIMKARGSVIRFRAAGCDQFQLFSR
ncbi:hypothetical protein B0F90DRAFT_1313317 [Multifurca ochricompacta]|uniref:Uncharacterized protein n=1 Tax=Multifurca ochricompacta TaxID=376703 RepID=A0AAD4M8U9_9AGAM|nr:hypothetical protein B0F90DRAFT_1313317 [Multifurca ochricompacta]